MTALIGRSLKPLPLPSNGVTSLSFSPTLDYITIAFLKTFSLSLYNNNNFQSSCEETLLKIFFF